MPRFQLSPTVSMIPSVGKRISQHGLKALHKASFYVTRSTSNSENSTECQAVKTQLTMDHVQQLPDVMDYTKGHSRSSSSIMTDLHLDESGVDWNFANQGRHMVQQAIETSLTASPSKSVDNFVRQMYVQGVSFLLRGLPQDLTLDEQLAIRGALSPQVMVPLVINQSEPAPPQYTQHTTDRSMLQRVLSSSIVHGYVIARTVIPHVAEVSSKLYQYEQDHKIVTNAAVSGVLMAGKVGRSGLVVGGSFLAMADGMVGGVVKSAAVWCFDGIVGGMHDAIGEVARLPTSRQ